MASQRIRPSLADLASLDLDAPAFSEWELNNAPAVSVSRTRPPTILSTSIPPPVPEIPFDEGRTSDPTATFTATGPSKPKSRFALQREKEAAAKLAGGTGTERFELDLDGHEESGGDDGNRQGGALPTATPRPSLVKDVLERPATRNAPPRPPTAPTLHAVGSRPAGFPPLGKGVFPRRAGSRPIPPPAVPPPSETSSSFDADQYVDGGTVDGILQSVSKENENVLSGMSEAQILEEQRQIREEMGLSEGMIKMLQERAQKKTQDGPTRRSRPPPSVSSERPQAPRAASKQQTGEEEDEEGTPEYIRKHFFPNEPVNPALDWMKPNLPSLAQPLDDQTSLPTTFTFDLHGSLVSSSKVATPESSAGDHHVSSSSNFTIPSLLSLTASSVPSQRSTAFTTLHRIVSHPSRYSNLIGSKDWTSLRHQLVQKAGRALRDPSRGVLISSIDLLSYLFESELASPPPPPSASLPNAEVAKTFLESFESSDPFPPLSVQLSLAGGTVPRSSLAQVLSLIEGFVALAPPGSLDVIFSTRDFLEAFVERFIATPWPPPRAAAAASAGNFDRDDEDDASVRLPSRRAVEVVSALARSSRSRAKALWSNKSALVEPTLRYLAVPPWDLAAEPDPRCRRGDVAAVGYGMLSAVLELWHVLARYGIGCQLRTVAAPLLEGDGGVIDRVVVESHLGADEDRGRDEVEWVGHVLRLMTVWTVASIDPHVTEHDIVWSQVEGWNHVACEVYAVAAEQGRKALVGQSLDLLASWLEGSKVNKSWRGEKEREWIRTKFGSDLNEGTGRNLIEAAMTDLAARRAHDVEEDDSARLVSAALRLSRAYQEPANPPTPALFTLDPNTVQATAETLIEVAYSGHRSIESLELVLLLLPLMSDPANRVRATIRLLPLLGPSQAVAARDLISYVLGTLADSASPASSQHSLVSTLHPELELPALVDLPLLEPFYVHLIVTASGGRVVGPSQPTPRDIKLTHSLSTASGDPSRLLSPDWPLSVLDELLRSSISPVFQQPPKNWDPSELQLVKSCLVLMRVVLDGRVPVERAVMIYDLVKVFMLEKDANPSSLPTERDLFSNPSIRHSMSLLAQGLRFSSKPHHTYRFVPPSRRSLAAGDAASSSSPSLPPAQARSPLEVVSDRFSTAPFYQLFTDLVGLYDSVSLSDNQFAQFVVVPTSQRYSIDYRRLVWTDYSHLLPGITLDVPDLLSDDATNDDDDEEEEKEGLLQRWLYPIETDETLLRTYLDELVKGHVTPGRNPFLSWVAVHHVSQAIFARRRRRRQSQGQADNDDNDNDDESKLRKKLVTVLLSAPSSADNVVRMVARYQPIEPDGSRLRGTLDECVEAGGDSLTVDEKEERIRIVEQVAGTLGATSRLRELLG